MSNFTSIDQMIKSQYSTTPERPHLTYKLDGVWQTKTYKESITDVFALAETLTQKGYSNKHFLIYAENSYEWIISDLAIIGYVGVSVAVDSFWQYDDVKNAINFTDVSVVLYSEKNIDVIKKLQADFSNVDFLSLSIDVPNFIDKGHDLLAVKPDVFDLEPRATDTMCKILFTSGTNGLPKAAILTQNNILSIKSGLDYSLHLKKEDIVFLFLPLRHVLASVDIEIYMMGLGMEVVICSNKNKLFEEMQETNPTILVSVPLIYEKLYAAKQVNVFGNRMKILVTGGALATPEVVRYFNESGISLVQGYGLTETSGAISVQHIDEIEEYKSVGNPFSYLSAKIINANSKGTGEIVLKGDCIFMGYYKNSTATKSAFTEDGYFKTGDLGYFDAGNRLCVTGRKKRIILTNNGENVYPDEIENMLNNVDIVEASKVFQDGNLIAAEIHTIGGGYSEEVNAIISNYNKKTPKYKQISRHRVLDIAAKMK